jgi:hypothetical protein
MNRLTAIYLNLILALISTQSAWATLGGDAQSVTADATQWGATVANVTATKSDLYSVSEIKTEGFKVKQFVAADSKTVFAVKWQGMGRPDLSVLLGTYYQDYNTALTAMPHNHGRAPTEITTSDIRVRLWGRQKNYGGVAFIPNAMPTGLTPEALK